MQPERPETPDRARAPFDVERRVKLLTHLAGGLAELGLVEEATGICRAIARLRAEAEADEARGAPAAPPPAERPAPLPAAMLGSAPLEA